MSDAQRAAVAAELASSFPGTTVVWGGPSNLWVAMPRADKDYDAVAQFYCRSLRARKITGVTVRVQDQSALLRNELETLGRATCSAVL